MTALPDFLNDAQDLLSEQGFASSNLWYHGTSSALVTSIQQQGLKGSGDQAMLEATKKTLSTLGDHYTETQQPVFLTPSKQLAYYWAQQTVSQRKRRFQGEEKPVVFEIKLPEEQNQQVKPDVGAASLLLLKEGEDYLAFLASLYQQQGLEMPSIDLMKADRQDYLKLLGMAYSDQDLAVDWIRLLEAL